MLKINHLDKFYNKGKNNEIHVINDVSIELPSTGLISFLGASGSGKTTLLNTIGGLDKANGEIDYGDFKTNKYDAKKIDEYRRNEIGYVFQNYNLLLEETVYNNLVIALEMNNVFDKEEQQKRIEYVLNAVGMYKYRKKKAYALSGGQQQRVAIARALIKKSKIIIADEPTGNLDHENTIIIMNILKNISLNTLVLLVTHNEEIANFYSDTIYKIKDGSIIDKYESNDLQTLENKDNNTIYLKDMNLKENDNDLVNVKYYTDKEDHQKITLKIVEKNGNFYIESDANIKIVQENNIKLLDKHYEVLKKDDLNKSIYDNSWFNEGKCKKKFGSTFFHNIKLAFNNLFNVKMKTKVLYVSFAITGLLFAFSLTSLSNFILVDDSRFETDNNYMTLHSDNFYSSDDETIILNQALDKNVISDVNRIIYLSYRYENNVNFCESNTIQTRFPTISYNANSDYKLIKGHEPKNNEIVISKNIADELINLSKNFFESYDDLIDLEIVNGDSNLFKIVGINNNPYGMSYLPDDVYLSYLADTHHIDDPFESKIRLYKVEKKYDTYEIINGRDLTEEDLDKNTTLAPYNEGYALGQQVNLLDNKIYKVIGTYKMKNNDINISIDEFIINSSTYSEVGSSPKYKYCFDYEDYEIVKGRKATNDNECMVSIYNDYQIGSKYLGKEIVGKYNGNYNLLKDGALFSRNTVAINGNIYAKSLFKVSDKQTLINLLNSKYNLMKAYNDLYEKENESKNINLAIFGTFSGILLIVLVIFIYFLMRSRMIQDIYNLGVYRSLGEKKSRIYGRFACDILVTVTLTSGIAYIIAMIIYTGISNNLNLIFGMQVLKNSFVFSSIGFILLYLLNIGFGLLPIYTLLKKTPAEILSKYDI